jgi:ABC-type enterochelin transport system permease subunit
LESLIVKIAKLLAVEFGEAGTKIIVANLSNNDFLNPMVPGAKMCAIFGFCIMNSFAETTELLQTKVILYHNMIAETVHSTVDKYLGATNKNIGEASWYFGNLRMKT